MKLIVDVTEKTWESIVQGTWCGSEIVARGVPFDSVVDNIKADIDELSRIHADGEFYVTNFDVKRIVYKHISEVGTSKSLPEGSDKE